MWVERIHTNRRGLIMEMLIPIIVQAISGVVGGGVVGQIVKQGAMALLPRLLAGGLGGIGGGIAAAQGLGIDPAALMSGDFTSILASIGGGAVGGGVLSGLAGQFLGKK